MPEEIFHGPEEMDELKECLPAMWSAELSFDERHVGFFHPLPAHLSHRDFAEISGLINESVEDANINQITSWRNRFRPSEFKDMPSFSYEIYADWPVDDKLLGVLRGISRLILERWPAEDK